jgi:hypothetical protein
MQHGRDEKGGHPQPEKYDEHFRSQRLGAAIALHHVTTSSGMVRGSNAGIAAIPPPAL